MEAIKYYVKGAFVGIAETPAVLEQQEELISDLTAKVADLVADGRTEEEALGMAIASMGDLSGLVREFATDDDAAATAAGPVEQVRTVEVYSARLRLHVVAISVGLSIGALFVLSIMGAVGGGFNGASAIWDLFLGVLGLVWVGDTVRRFHEDPTAVGEVEAGGRAPLQRALLQWVGVCAGAVFLNAVLQADGFWAWTVWIAAVAWPLSFYLEQRMVAAGRFLHPKQESAATSANAACAASCGSV